MEASDDFILRISDPKLKKLSETELHFPICKFFEMLLGEYWEDNKLTISVFLFVENNSQVMYLPTTSVIKRYILGGKRKGVEAFQKAVVVKLRNENPEYNKYKVGILHENEMLAYEIIFPLLIEDLGIGSLPIVESYYSVKNAIIMENLNQSHYFYPDKCLKGITAFQCRVILKYLAKFHAHSLICKKRKPEKFKEIETLPKEVLFYYKQSESVEYMGLFFEKLIKVFETERTYNADLEGVISTLKKIRKNFVNEIKKLIFHTDEYSVFCHGDLRASNIFICHDKGEVKFIDFQQICYSSIARDLVTLFYVNLQPRDIGSLMRSFLIHYLKHLHIFLKREGVDLKDKLTLEWLNNEMMKFQLYGIVFGLWHSVEFYIENITEGNLIEKLNQKKYGKADLGSDFYGRAKYLVSIYRNQKSSVRNK